MIVPFLFELETAGEYDHLVVMYKYLNMTKKYGWPIIAHERYFNSLAFFEKIGVNQAWFDTMCDKFGFERPTQDDLDNIPKYIISEEFEQSIINYFPSKLDAWIYLLQNRFEPLEIYLEQMINQIVADFNEPIEAFICYCSNASLKYIAAKKGIPIIHNESGPFRLPVYRQKVGYFDFCDVYDCGESEERYQAFLRDTQQKKVPILSRKEILRIFMTDEYAKEIPLVDTESSFDIGLSINTFNMGLILRHTHMTDVELDWLARKNFPVDRILRRVHPGHPYTALNINDDSPSSFHFICKCKRIAAVMSSLLFEAMLIGRIPYAYGNSPFSFMSNHGIGDPNDKLVPLEFVNFATFAYLVPWEFISDSEYIRYRLSRPSETDIYMKHYDYYVKRYNEQSLL